MNFSPWQTGSGPSWENLYTLCTDVYLFVLLCTTTWRQPGISFFNQSQQSFFLKTYIQTDRQTDKTRYRCFYSKHKNNQQKSKCKNIFSSESIYIYIYLNPKCYKKCNIQGENDQSEQSHILNSIRGTPGFALVWQDSFFFSYFIFLIFIMLLNNLIAIFCFEKLLPKSLMDKCSAIFLLISSNTWSHDRRCKLMLLPWMLTVKLCTEPFI